ncbi:hypothetical protein FQR65_LT15992 [Abscondita terminalis]|nr:hypothetical protein FQR65_LT15992 [Abscondita terminalis]
MVKCINLCNEELCADYLTKNTCPQLPDACEIQNSTHNGLFLPGAGPCNCCEYCVENLGRDEECSTGDPSVITPTSICGSGLSCQKALEDEVGTCQPMDSPCVNQQVAYDQNVQLGNIGYLETKPSCAHDGSYNYFHCVPGEICFCVSEDGERIFGEVLFTPNPYFFLKCACSRNYHKAKQINDRNLYPSEYFRCQPNGDYDTIQCINKKCLCVDADNGHMTYPEKSMVNITQISASNLPCFNNETHMEADYYKDCESAYLDALNTTKQYQKDGFEMIGKIMPNCQLDGRYAPVQETLTTKYCSDVSGNRLGNYELVKTNPLALTMNCNCARIRTILYGYETPECCINGNYKPIQKRRGLCRCVDKNGVQVGKEVDCRNVDQLKCFTDVCAA